jgi:hypothetical protein
MVLRPIQRQRNPSEFSNGSSDVVIKTHFIIGSYQWAAIFRGKNYVIEEISVRVAHASKLSRVSRQIFIKGRRPLRGLSICWDSFPGVRCAHPGLYAAVRDAHCTLEEPTASLQVRRSVLIMSRIQMAHARVE